ncbi:hypothetical protein [Pedobacter alpinus]|uniref:RelA/SpoT domain-containing protein n=1 Tax=Pedobacter alpinus TaxID=1590643 RepID=A0ABW5TPA0_9SPHI
MSVDIKNITDSWAKEEPLYEELGKIIFIYIKKHITEHEILPEIFYRTKDLLSIIKKIKKKQREKEYDFKDLKDKLGIRIICNYKEELDKVDSFLKSNFRLLKTEYKQDVLNFDKLDYTSNHYDASLKLDIEFFKDKAHLSELVFEIQVRTLNQHAWSNTSHQLSYKQEADIQPYLKRRVYRLLSLYEIADDEFSAVNKVLSDNPDNIIYSLIRKLEGKIYKYAQVDFDRVSSLINIKIIINYLDIKQQEKLLNQIDEFINIRKDKINQIFEDNRIRFHQLSFITQPEIFVIWYCLENFYFEIVDEWENDMDLYELEESANLWGLSLQ